MSEDIKAAQPRLIKQSGNENPASVQPKATMQDCEAYVSKFPSGPWASYARSIIEEIQKEEERKETDFFLSCSTLDDYGAYLGRYPKGKYRKSCEQKIETLRWESWKDSYRGCKRYLKGYPAGPYSAQAKERVCVFEKKRRRVRQWVLSVAAVCLIVISALNWHPVRKFEIESELLSVSKWGDVRKVQILSNVDGKQIDASVAVDWVVLGRERDKVFVLSFDKCNDKERQCTVRFRAFSTFFNWRYASKSKELSLRQESGLPSYFTIDKDELSFDKFGNDDRGASVVLRGDGVSVEPVNGTDWITIGGCSVSRHTDGFRIPVDIYVSKNTSDARSAVVVFHSGNISVPLRIRQESGLASYLSLEHESILLSEEEVSVTQYYSCHVNTDGTIWYIVSSPSWLHGGQIRMETQKNDGNIKRGSIVVHSNNDHTASVEVIQQGNPTSLTPSTGIVSAGTGSGSRTISINNDSYKPLSCSVSSDDEDWLRAYVSGNSITLYYDANDSFSRIGDVKVFCGDKECSISVWQDGWKTCNACGGNRYRTCDASGMWTNSFGSYSYMWVNNRHVIRRIYTKQQYDPYWGWMPVPASEDTDCDRCHGTGRMECRTCGGKGRIEDKW